MVFFGAFFTSLALMTKGLFTLIPISSGVIGLWLFEKRYNNFLSAKWITAPLFSFFLATPEFFALYKQFGLKGIHWYFIGSQFGRFFDNGRITKGNASVFFFVRTFLWAFLPWTLGFVFSIIHFFKKRNHYSSIETSPFVFLLSSFFPTFFLFSISKFQVDHYTNILFPFAAILSAWFFIDTSNRKFFIWQIAIILTTILLSVIVFLLAYFKTPFHHFCIGAAVSILAFLGIVYIVAKSNVTLKKAVLIFSVTAINILFISSIVLMNFLEIHMNAGYVFAQYLNNNESNKVIYEYPAYSNFIIYNKSNVLLLQNNKINFVAKKAYIVVNGIQNIKAIEQHFKKNANLVLLIHSYNTSSLIHELVMTHHKKLFMTSALFLIKE